MFYSHLSRLSKSKISLAIFLVIIFVPVWDALQIYIEYQKLGGEKLHPAHAFFLSGSSTGHIPQYLLLWFLPLFLLILGTEDSMQDFENGYQNILINRVGRKFYILEKMFFSFLIGFTAMISSLIINFILVSILFQGGKYTKGLSEIAFESSFTNFILQNPYAGVLIFILIASVLSGFAGLVGASCSLFFKDRKYTYSATFFLWFVFVIQDNSIMHLFQSFSEYGLGDLIPVFSFLILFYIFISGSVFFYEVKKNESI